MSTFRRIAVSAAATSFAAGMLLTAALAPSATAGPKTAVEQAGNASQATVTIGERAVDPAPLWREKVAEHPDRVKEMWAYSPSMDRHVPLFVITPKDNSQPRPTIYLLNGADGGEGKANWVMQTDIVDFYMDKNVNVVIPMSGQYSYYTDWVSENANLGGKQTWETFLTKELPGPLEKTLKASNQRAIAGMSMTATTSLLYAEHHPGFYDAVGSFSGCAQTSEGPALEYVRTVLNRGKATPEEMWGPVGTETWAYNDALINAEKLRGTPMYVSNGSGVAGQSDMVSSPHMHGDPGFAAGTVIIGGAIEGATNLCTHDLKARLDAAGIGADWNFHPTGTHSWGYWQDDLRGSWPTFARAFGMQP